MITACFITLTMFVGFGSYGNISINVNRIEYFRDKMVKIEDINYVVKESKEEIEKLIKKECSK